MTVQVLCLLAIVFTIDWDHAVSGAGCTPGTPAGRRGSGLLPLVWEHGPLSVPVQSPFTCAQRFVGRAKGFSAPPDKAYAAPCWLSLDVFVVAFVPGSHCLLLVGCFWMCLSFLFLSRPRGGCVCSWVPLLLLVGCFWMCLSFCS